MPCLEDWLSWCLFSLALFPRHHLPVKTCAPNALSHTSAVALDPLHPREDPHRVKWDKRGRRFSARSCHSSLRGSKAAPGMFHGL